MLNKFSLFWRILQKDLFIGLFDQNIFFCSFFFFLNKEKVTENNIHTNNKNSLIFSSLFLILIRYLFKIISIMKKILFLCEGNICRSPTAMFLLRDLLAKHGLSDKYEVTSAGVDRPSEGKGLEPRAKAVLEAHHIPCEGHVSRYLVPKIYFQADIVLYMEQYNRILLSRLLSHPDVSKCHRLYDYTGVKKDIADPYFTGDFETAYNDIEKGVTAFFEKEILTGKF